MSSRDDHDIHFLKKVDENTLRNGDLRIPRSFVIKYWKDISNPLLLLLPKGAEWKVNWKKMGVDIWLIDEWKKFIEFYSLDEDYLLIFKYVGMSRFEVVIVDQSGLDIVYPSMATTSYSAENGNSSGELNITKSLPGSSFSKKVKTNPRKEPEISQDVENACAHSQHANDLDNAKPKKRGRKRKICANVISSNSGDQTIQSESEELVENTKSGTAVERAQAFRSENPYFVRRMHASYIERHVMVMAGSFLTKEEEEEHDILTLWTSEERAWHVHYYRNHSSGQINLTKGWMDFVKDNNLQMGNVCVFEKIEKLGISFRVYIYSDKEESSSPMISDHKIHRSNKVFENNFSVCIKPNQFYLMNVPRLFFKNHGIANPSIVTLQVGEQSWKVKLDSYCRFSSGWYDFMRECRLKPGDVCRLELIDKKKIVFKVTIVAGIQ